MPDMNPGPEIKKRFHGNSCMPVKYANIVVKDDILFTDVANVN